MTVSGLALDVLVIAVPLAIAVASAQWPRVGWTALGATVIAGLAAWFSGHPPSMIGGVASALVCAVAASGGLAAGRVLGSLRARRAQTTGAR